jgi:hypothetical protein
MAAIPAGNWRPTICTTRAKSRVLFVLAPNQPPSWMISSIHVYGDSSSASDLVRVVLRKLKKEDGPSVRLKIGSFFRQRFRTTCPRTAPGRPDLPLLPSLTIASTSLGNACAREPLTSGWGDLFGSPALIWQQEILRLLRNFDSCGSYKKEHSTKIQPRMVIIAMQ